MGLWHSELTLAFFPSFGCFFFIFRSSNVQTDFKKKMIRKLKLLNTEYYNAIKIFIQIQKLGYRFSILSSKLLKLYIIMTS